MLTLHFCLCSIHFSELFIIEHVQIERHWSLYAVPELTLEKLQMIATSNVTASYKVKWLKWLNASGPSREARRFPPRPVNEEKLFTFLTKACWYAGVSKYTLFFDVLLSYLFLFLYVRNILSW
jgi:hypothetical protein